jgi:hypothetical protein
MILELPSKTIQRGTTTLIERPELIQDIISLEGTT